MKAILLRIDNQYFLEDLLDNLIATSENSPYKSLSMKNCQAIERGYDLDGLANEYSEGKSTADVFKRAHEEDFKAGFQKALELIGDKKFSEADIKQVMYLSRGSKYTKDEVIEQIQKTGWNVDIEMKWNPKLSFCDECGNGGSYMSTPCDHPNDCKHWSPKLDPNGCLILKIAK